MYVGTFDAPTAEVKVIAEICNVRNVNFSNFSRWVTTQYLKPIGVALFVAMVWVKKIKQKKNKQQTVYMIMSMYVFFCS